MTASVTLERADGAVTSRGPGAHPRRSGRLKAALATTVTSPTLHATALLVVAAALVLVLPVRADGCGSALQAVEARPTRLHPFVPPADDAAQAAADRAAISTATTALASAESDQHAADQRLLEARELQEHGEAAQQAASTAAYSEATLSADSAKSSADTAVAMDQSSVQSAQQSLDQYQQQLDDAGADGYLRSYYQSEVTQAQEQLAEVKSQLVADQETAASADSAASSADDAVTAQQQRADDLVARSQKAMDAAQDAASTASSAVDQAQSALDDAKQDQSDHEAQHHDEVAAAYSDWTDRHELAQGQNAARAACAKDARVPVSAAGVCLATAAVLTGAAAGGGLRRAHRGRRSRGR